MAISHGEEGVLYIFGRGEYIGETVPKGAAGFMGKLLEEEEVKNPTIKLDSGELVYGCECWWGSEAKCEERFANFKEVKTISIVERRKAAEEEVERMELSLEKERGEGAN